MSCDGDCDQTAYIDDCNECDDMACDGDCDQTAYIDDCNEFDDSPNTDCVDMVFVLGLVSFLFLVLVRVCAFCCIL